MKRKNIPAVVLAGAMLLSACGLGGCNDKKETTSGEQSETSSLSTEDNGVPVFDPNETVIELSTMELVADMGIGINLGDTLDCWGDSIPADSVKSYETSAGSPEITKEIIAGYAQAGFRTVRVPVAWSNRMANDFTIDTELLDRTEEIIGWILDNDMYAVLTLCADGGWMEGFLESYDECRAKYLSIWSQLCERFQKYGTELLFESIGAALKFGEDGADSSMGTETLCSIQQEFINLVRSTGGVNSDRHLLLTGYGADISLTCNPAFTLPQDEMNRYAISVQYYAPAAFCTDDASGEPKTTWGDAADDKALKADFDLLQTTFINNDIPVVLSEYGVTAKDRPKEAVQTYLTAVCEEASSRGICPILWDVPGQHYDRTACKMADTALGDALRAIAESAKPEASDTEKSQSVADSVADFLSPEDSVEDSLVEEVFEEDSTTEEELESGADSAEESLEEEIEE